MSKGRRRAKSLSSKMKGFQAFSDSFSGSIKSGWKEVRSGWSLSGTDASTSTTDYAISTVRMVNENVTIDIKTDKAGTGAALWVSDSGSWWGVVTSQETCPGCGSCSSYNPCVGTGGNCASYAGGNCAAANGSNCISGTSFCSGTYNTSTCNSYNSSNCKAYGGGNCASNGRCSVGSYYYTCCKSYNPTVCNSYNGSNCNSYNGSNCNAFGFTCNGGYNTSYCNAYNPVYCSSANPYNPCGAGNSCASNYDTYPQKIKLIKYASNIATEIASQTIESITSFTPIKAIRVAITSSNKSAQTATVTAKAFSDDTMVTQIGSDMIYNATGVIIATDYGIIASPSSYNQGNTITSVNIS